MRLIDNRLYVEFAEMVQCGVSEAYLKKAKSTDTRCWTFMKDPQDGRKVLIDFEEMKPVYREMVERRFGNPYEHVARTPILNMLELDWRANEFFMGYRYYVPSAVPGRHEEKQLPAAVVNKYTRAAAWLELVNKVNGNKKILTNELGLSVSEFPTWLS